MNEKKMTKEEFLANRKAAGRVIDPETCAIHECYVDLADPYGVNRPPLECIGRVTRGAGRVRSYDGRGIGRGSD